MRARITPHFHRRLMERYGIELTPSESDALQQVVLDYLAVSPPTDDELRDSVQLECSLRGNAMIVIYRPRDDVIITLHAGARRGRHLFVKKVLPKYNPVREFWNKQGWRDFKSEKFAKRRKRARGYWRAND